MGMVTEGIETEAERSNVDLTLKFKNQCGLGEYQARKWRSWHHHMAMVMMAMLFMLEQRLLHKEKYPLLSFLISSLSFRLFFRIERLINKNLFASWRSAMKGDAQPLSRRTGSSCDPCQLMSTTNVTK